MEDENDLMTEEDFGTNANTSTSTNINTNTNTQEDNKLDPNLDLMPRIYSTDHGTSNLEPFMGFKARRRSSLHKVFQGDYLHISSNMAVLKILAKHGDQSVIFADSVVKFNRSNQITKRILIITEAAIYILETTTFRLKRRISHPMVSSLNLSELSDNFFSINVPFENDLLLASTRKTEIVTVMVEAYKSFMENPLTVNFSNKFEYQHDPETIRELTFEETEGGVITRFTPVEKKNDFDE